ncbi:MAG: hypothetical protein JNM27_09340 [Leptospirales bacterium]|nr:hypothetical protein [Leptospirales bacterium]
MLRNVIAILLLAASMNCAAMFDADKTSSFSNEELFVILLLLSQRQDACSGVGVPVLASAQGTGSMGGAAGSISGRLLTASGAPVVSALVIAEDSGSTGITFFSSHTSIARDGSFLISGIPGGSTVKLSFEPIDSGFKNRIDKHIDCFMTPSTFTVGWAPNTGSSLVSTKGSGRTYTITTGATNNAGNIFLN